MKPSSSTLIGICLFCFQVSLPAQSNPATSRMSTAMAEKQKRIDSLTDLSYDALQIPAKRAEARNYAVEARQLATEIDYHKGLGDSYMRLGKIEADEGNWEESLSNYRQAIKMRAKIGDLTGTASCYNMLGDMYKLRGDLDSAALSFNTGIDLLRGPTVYPIVLKLYSNLGHVYSLTGKYAAGKTALDSALLLCAIYSKENGGAGKDTWADARMNWAELLQTRLHQTKDARDSLIQCLEDYKALRNDRNTGKCLLLLGNNAYYNGDMETARGFYQQGLDLGDKISPADYNVLLRNRGRTYLDQGQFDKALVDFRASLAAFQQQENHPGTAGALFEIGNFYNETSSLDSAIYYYRAALEHDIQDPTLKGRLLYFLSDVLYQNGDEAGAQRLSKDYIALLEALTADQTKGAFAETMQHFMDKNRLQRRIIEQEKQVQKTYGVIALAALALLTLLTFLFARFQRQKRHLAERDAEIARQQESLAKQKEEIAVREHLETLKNKELDTHYARLEGQDAMQKKIGQELHDSVGAMLASVKLNLSPVDEVLDRLPEDKRQQYANANRLLGEASEELRRISHELNSAVLLKFGLKEQLEALSDIIPGSGKLQVELVTHGLKERLDYKTELNIYRMVQELVHNVVKHAHAKNISIQVNRFGDRINVIVEDDGVGFDVAKIREKPGLGMQNLAARVHDLGGELQIDSRPGHGTTVSIDIPLKS
jgi:hypothetical protein